MFHNILVYIYMAKRKMRKTKKNRQNCGAKKPVDNNRGGAGDYRRSARFHTNQPDPRDYCRDPRSRHGQPRPHRGLATAEALASLQSKSEYEFWRPERRAERAKDEKRRDKRKMVEKQKSREITAEALAQVQAAAEALAQVQAVAEAEAFAALTVCQREAVVEAAAAAAAAAEAKVAAEGGRQKKNKKNKTKNRKTKKRKTKKSQKRK